jgi:hypothetical protein
LPERNTGLFISYNCDTGNQAFAGFQKAFMDHYYPAPETQELKPVKPLPDRVAQCVGEYSSLRRSFTTLTKLAAIMDTIHVRVDSDGYLWLGGPLRWVEVAPLLFRASKGQQRLAFRTDASGNTTYLFFGGDPSITFVRLRWYETSAFHHAVAAISLLVMLSALTVWPIAAFCRRGRAGPTGPPRAARLVGWIMGLLFLLFFCCVLRVAADPEQFILGVPSEVRRALWLPLLAIPLLAATTWFSVKGWKRNYWGLAGRIHYSLVTVAGLTLLGWLHYWNLLGFHYK